MRRRSLLLKPIVSILLGLMLLGLLPSGALVARAERGITQTDPPPAPSAQRSLYLPLIGTSGPSQGGPSSLELIDAALERGEIDAEAALIYQVFATFGDPRLPSQYQGNDSQPSDREIAGELAERFATLSPQAKATLKPFTIPPYHAGSWWDLSRQPRGPGVAAYRPCDMLTGIDVPFYEDWEYLDSDGGHVRIWWLAKHPEDASKARALIEVVETIWGHLTTLMGRQPPTDGGGLRPCRGGSDRLDISLVDILGPGEVWRYDLENPQPGPWPSVMLLKRNPVASAENPGLTPTQMLRAALIHELMHTFQLAFNISDYEEYKWWREATATWAIHYVEGLELGWETNYEHGYAGYMLNEPELPLETLLLNAYGAYLFPYYLQLHTDSIGPLLRQSFERSEKIADSLENLNALLKGGFEKQWPEFTLRMLNRPPVDDFAKNDGLKPQVKLKLDEAVALNGAADRSYVLDGNVRHLASHAFRFTFDSPEARSVYFINPFFKGDWPTASVRALFKIDGVWQSDNWTTDPAAGFCRDLKAERLQELILVISNSEWQDRSHTLKPAEIPRLNVTNVACRGWTSTMTATRDETGEQTNIHEQTTITGTWIRRKLEGEVRVDRPFELYRTVETKATWTHQGSEHGCAGGGSGAVALNSSEQTWLAIYTHATDKTGRIYLQGTRRYNGFGGDTPAYLSQKVIYRCPNGSTREKTIGSVASWFLTEVEPTQQVSADGTQIKGSWVLPKYDPHTNYRTTYTYVWTMTALPPE